MPQKPIRLPPMKVLRVRNPNFKQENPCVTVMSSVLGTSWSHTVLARLANGFSTGRNRTDHCRPFSVLGLCRIQHRRVRCGRAISARMHGRPETATGEEKHNQLPPHAIPERHYPRTEQEEISSGRECSGIALLNTDGRGTTTHTETHIQTAEGCIETAAL